MTVTINFKHTRPLAGFEGKDATSRVHRKLGFLKFLDWKMMLALFLPVTLETLDYTVVATAQSRIASIFNALPLESYIGTSYLLASTVFLPLFASIADVYGRHFGLQLSLAFFLAGSALATGALNMPMVLAGRGIAGIGAAGLLTTVRTVMSDTVSLDQNNIQQSILFLLYSGGYTVGPFIGGILVTTNFRWVFGINLPCTALAMILCYIFLRNKGRTGGVHEPETAVPNPKMNVGSTSAANVSWISKLALIDWIGTLLFVGGGILALLALNWGPTDNWKSARVIVSFILGTLLIAVCIFWEIILERRSSSSSPSHGLDHIQTRYPGIFRARPMLPIELFTSYDMCAAQYSSFISGIVMFVMFYFVSIFTTVVTGLAPTKAGIQLLYFAPGLGGGTLISIVMIKRLKQPVYPIVLGNIIMMVGVGLIELAIQHNAQTELDGFMALAGVGVGMGAGPLVIHARFTKPKHVAATNAMLLFFRALGGTVGLAQCFTVLSAKVNGYIASQLVTLANNTLDASDLATLTTLYDSGGLTSLTSLNGLPIAVQAVIKEAFRDGVRWGFLSLLPWLGVGCILSVFMSKLTNLDEEDVEEGEDELAVRRTETGSESTLRESTLWGGKMRDSDMSFAAVVPVPLWDDRGRVVRSPHPSYYETRRPTQ